MYKMYYSRNSKKRVYHESWCMYVPRKALFGKLRSWTSSSKSVATDLGYTECKWCGGMHGLYLRLREENRHNDISLCYDRDNNRICFRTNCGFWNVRLGDNGYFWLYHLNHGLFDPEAKDTELMLRKHHRQKDVKETDDIYYIMEYISRHDRMKPIVDKDWRKLPKTTKKKRKYYNQAKRRAERKAIRNLDKIFEQIEQERKEKELKHGA